MPDLHVVLLERNARRVQLTEAGEALLPEAQAVLDAALAARDAVEGLSRGLRRAVGIRELEHETFIDLPPGFAMRTVADEVFAAYGLRRAIAAEVSGIDATAAFVRAGVGIAILPAYAITPHANLRAIKVREHDFRWSSGLA
jgi:DNA-binding transcriptional LysR family regulator